MTVPAIADKSTPARTPQEFFDQSQATKKTLAAEYIANQKSLDAALLPALSADLKAYLSTRFTLKDGDRPHLLKF